MQVSRYYKKNEFSGYPSIDNWFKLTTRKKDGIIKYKPMKYEN